MAYRITCHDHIRKMFSQRTKADCVRSRATVLIICAAATPPSILADSPTSSNTYIFLTGVLSSAKLS